MPPRPLDAAAEGCDTFYGGNGSMRKLFPFLLVAFVALPSAFSAPVDPANFSESIYVSSALIGSTTGIAWAPDGSGRLFVARKGGFSGQQNAEVRIVQNGAVLATPFATESVYTASECGLIGMAFDPDFVNNGYVYFFVTCLQFAAENRALYRSRKRWHQSHRDRHWFADDRRKPRRRRGRESGMMAGFIGRSATTAMAAASTPISPRSLRKSAGPIVSPAPP